MRLMLAQLDNELGDLDSNVARAQDVLGDAQSRGADLVVFPELFLTGYCLGQVAEDVAINVYNPRIRKIAAAAGEVGVVLGFQQAGRVAPYNSVVYLQDGVAVHVHQKTYLPTYNTYEEGKYFRAGASMRAFDTRVGRLAMPVCNDAWQPQLMFIAVQDGAQMLVVPANSAQYHLPEMMDNETYWRMITRFYATLFACYVVFVNRVGREADFKFWGGSHVVDPWGEIVTSAPNMEEALVAVDIDLGEVRRRRRAMPLIKDARLGMLRRELDRLIAEGGDL